jgi:hypothetical protein
MPDREAQLAAVGPHGRHPQRLVVVLPLPCHQRGEAMKWLAALVVIAWAVVIAYARRERPVPATRYADDDVQPWDSRSVTLASGNAEWVN